MHDPEPMDVDPRAGGAAGPMDVDSSAGGAAGPAASHGHIRRRPRGADGVGRGVGAEPHASDDDISDDEFAAANELAAAIARAAPGQLAKRDGANNPMKRHLDSRDEDPQQRPKYRGVTARNQAFALLL